MSRSLAAIRIAASARRAHHSAPSTIRKQPYCDSRGVEQRRSPAQQRLKPLHKSSALATPKNPNESSMFAKSPLVLLSVVADALAASPAPREPAAARPVCGRRIVEAFVAMPGAGKLPTVGPVWRRHRRPREFMREFDAAAARSRRAARARPCGNQTVSFGWSCLLRGATFVDPPRRRAGTRSRANVASMAWGARKFSISTLWSALESAA